MLPTSDQRSKTKGSRLTSPFVTPPPSFTLPIPQERSESSLSDSHSHNHAGSEDTGTEEYSVIAGGPERTSLLHPNQETPGESRSLSVLHEKPVDSEENEIFYSFGSCDRGLSDVRDRDIDILDGTEISQYRNRFSPMVIEEAKAKYMVLTERARFLAVRGTTDALAEAVALLTANAPWDEVDWQSLYESYKTTYDDLTRKNVRLHKSERANIRLVQERDQLHLQLKQLQDEIDEHNRRTLIRAPVQSKEPIIAPGYSKEDFESMRNAYGEVRDHAASLTSQLHEAKRIIADTNSCINMALTSQRDLQCELYERDTVQTQAKSRPTSTALDSTPKRLKSLLEEGVLENGRDDGSDVDEAGSTNSQLPDHTPDQDESTVRWTRTSLISVSDHPETFNTATQEQVQVLRQRLSLTTRSTYVNQSVQVAEVDLQYLPSHIESSSQRLWFKPVEEWYAVEPCTIIGIVEGTLSTQEDGKAKNPRGHPGSPEQPGSPVHVRQSKIHNKTGIREEDYPEFNFPSSPEFRKAVEKPFSHTSVDSTASSSSLSYTTAVSRLNGRSLSKSGPSPELEPERKRPSSAIETDKEQNTIIKILQGNDKPDDLKHTSFTDSGRDKDTVSMVKDELLPNQLTRISQLENLVREPLADDLSKRRIHEQIIWKQILQWIERLRPLKSPKTKPRPRTVARKSTPNANKIVPSKLHIRRDGKDNGGTNTDYTTPEELSPMPRLSHESITALLRQLEKDQADNRELNQESLTSPPRESVSQKDGRSIEEIRQSALRALEGVGSQAWKQQERIEDPATKCCLERLIFLVSGIYSTARCMVKHGFELQIGTALYLMISVWFFSTIYGPYWKWQEVNQDYVRRDVTSWRQRTWRPETPYSLQYMLEAAVSIWGKPMEAGWYA